MAISYFKRLFEVRILHEYFLLDARHPEFFALDEQERASIINDKLSQNRFDIWKYLSIEPTEESLKLFKGMHFKLVLNPTGFFIGLEVKPIEKGFVPFISLGKQVDFTFRLNIKDTYFKNYTNLRLKAALPANYYFTNENSEAEKTFPSLSVPVPPFQIKNFYEMGEMARINGVLKEGLERTKSAISSKWEMVKGEGFANEGDRILLPHQFYYVFEKEQQVSQCQFVLKTLAGVALSNIAVQQEEKIHQALLDFRMDQQDKPQEIPPGLYDLEVLGNDNFKDKTRIYLHSTWYNPASLGVIKISNTEDDPNFSLLTPAGLLKKPHPVFEIRFRSRKTFWRYLVQEKPFKLSEQATKYLKKKNGSLKTLKPWPLTRSPMEFKSDDPATEDVNERIFMPNPANAGIKQEADGRIYSDIYISLIKDLIIKDNPDS